MKTQTIYAFLFEKKKRAFFFLLYLFALIGARIWLYHYARHTEELSVWRLVWVEGVFVLLVVFNYSYNYGLYVKRHVQQGGYVRNKREVKK